MRFAAIGIAIFLAAVLLVLPSCKQKTATLDEIGRQLTKQFQSQHEPIVPARKKIVHVKATSFTYPPGNPKPYMGIEVMWRSETGDLTRTETGCVMVPLGDGVFGVTFQPFSDQVSLSAVVDLR